MWTGLQFGCRFLLSRKCGVLIWLDCCFWSVSFLLFLFTMQNCGIIICGILLKFSVIRYRELEFEWNNAHLHLISANRNSTNSRDPIWSADLNQWRWGSLQSKLYCQHLWFSSVQVTCYWAPTWRAYNIYQDKNEFEWRLSLILGVEFILRKCFKIYIYLDHISHYLDVLFTSSVTPNWLIQYCWLVIWL